MAREEIEVFDEDHLYGCAGLYASVFSLEPWGEPWTTEKARERLAEIYYSPGFEGLVCVVGGEPVGLALGNRVRRAVGRGFLLHEFCVRAEMQGSGMGGRLLACLEDRLREAGVGSVFLLTGSDTPARGFYAKNGYGEDREMATMAKVL